MKNYQNKTVEKLLKNFKTRKGEYNIWKKILKNLRKKIKKIRNINKKSIL